MTTPSRGLSCSSLLCVMAAVSGCDESSTMPTQPSAAEPFADGAPAALRIRDGDYVFRSINPFSSQQAWGMGINGEREVVGAWRPEPDTTIVGFRGYHFEDGEFTKIRFPRSIGTVATGINDRGVIVGFFAEWGPGGAAGPLHGFLFKDDRYIRLPDPESATHLEPNAINSRGVIAGIVGTPDGERGFTYRHGSYTLIDCGEDRTRVNGINRWGDVTGECGDNRGFLQSGDEVTVFDYPDAAETVARGINDDGDIVGSYAVEEDGADHGFLLDRDGNFTTIDFPGAEETKLSGINNRGDLVGTWVDAEGVERGFRARALGASLVAGN